MRFDIITLFPEIIEHYCSFSIVGRAFKENIATLETHQLRNFGLGKHRKVDDYPYGGGTGLLLSPEPLFAAYNSVPKLESKSKTILLTPRGQTLTQPFIRNELLLQEQLIIFCGHYEGFDERIMSVVDYPVSLGNFVLTGGELGALILVDAIARLLPGVLPKGESAHGNDSFADSEGKLLEAPQYTRPAEFNGMKVPEILLSGNHKEIEKWRLSFSGIDLKNQEVNKPDE